MVLIIKMKDGSNLEKRKNVFIHPGCVKEISDLSDGVIYISFARQFALRTLTIHDKKLSSELIINRLYSCKGLADVVYLEVEHYTF